MQTLQERLTAFERRLAALEARVPAPPPPKPERPAAPSFPPRFRHLLGLVAEEFGVTTDAILSERRNAEIVRPRQVLMALAVSVLNMSLLQVARLLERDHTTVMHARDRVAEACREAADFGARLDRLAEAARGERRAA